MALAFGCSRTLPELDAREGDSLPERRSVSEEKKGAKELTAPTKFAWTLEILSDSEFVVTLAKRDSTVLLDSLELGLVPRLAGGVIVGVRIVGSSDGYLWGALGLEMGDVVVEINGVRQNNSVIVGQSEERMFGMQFTTIKYLRDGELHSLRYEVRYAE